MLLEVVTGFTAAVAAFCVVGVTLDVVVAAGAEVSSPMLSTILTPAGTSCKRFSSAACCVGRNFPVIVSEFPTPCTLAFPLRFRSASAFSIFCFTCAAFGVSPAGAFATAGFRGASSSFSLAGVAVGNFSKFDFSGAIFSAGLFAAEVFSDGASCVGCGVESIGAVAALLAFCCAFCCESDFSAAPLGCDCVVFGCAAFGVAPGCGVCAVVADASGCGVGVSVAAEAGALSVDDCAAVFAIASRRTSGWRTSYKIGLSLYAPKPITATKTIAASTVHTMLFSLGGS